MSEEGKLSLCRAQLVKKGVVEEAREELEEGFELPAMTDEFPNGLTVTEGELTEGMDRRGMPTLGYFAPCFNRYPSGSKKLGERRLSLLWFVTNGLLTLLDPQGSK